VTRRRRTPQSSPPLAGPGVPPVPYGPRHRRLWQKLWRRCSCGLPAPCIDARLAPPPPVWPDPRDRHLDPGTPDVASAALRDLAARPAPAIARRAWRAGRQQWRRPDRGGLFAVAGLFARVGLFARAGLIARVGLFARAGLFTWPGLLARAGLLGRPGNFARPATLLGPGASFGSPSARGQGSSQAGPFGAGRSLVASSSHRGLLDSGREVARQV
jgi:hypothetical protein